MPRISPLTESPCEHCSPGLMTYRERLHSTRIHQLLDAEQREMMNTRPDAVRTMCCVYCGSYGHRTRSCEYLAPHHPGTCNDRCAVDVTGCRCVQCLANLIHQIDRHGYFSPRCDGCVLCDPRIAEREREQEREQDCDCDYCTDDDDDDDDGYWGTDYDSPSELVMPWDWCPRARFLGEGNLFYGFELELDTNQPVGIAAELVTDAMGGIVYLKEDGCIGHGFEIVTHPMSYEFIQTAFPWERFGRVLRDADMMDHDNLGLHVHVSRSGFSSAAHTFRWLQLLHRNSDRVCDVARRNSVQWARWHESFRINSKWVALEWPQRSLPRCQFAAFERSSLYGNYTSVLDDRYQAINPTNRNTFEVRVFASTTDIAEIRAALELVDASVEYTRQLTSHEILKRDGWAWDQFIDWTDRTGRYENLNAMTRQLVAA